LDACDQLEKLITEIAKATKAVLGIERNIIISLTFQKIQRTKKPKNDLMTFLIKLVLKELVWQLLF
jgi:hypothetical protein